MSPAKSGIRPWQRTRFVPGSLFALALLAFFGDAAAQQQGTTMAIYPRAATSSPAALAGNDDLIREAPTFAKDVALILQQNCQVCHQPGSIGPMSLMSYDEVRPWARLLKVLVESREMPPYHYDVDVGIQELKHDKRLSQQDIETIVAWVDAGAPLGDPADLPPPVQLASPHEWTLATEMGRDPDLVIKTDPFDLKAGGQDTWWRPIVATGLTEDRCIRAVAVRASPRGRQVVHHANSDLLVPNEQGELEQVERVSEYALGKIGEIVPEGACRTLPAHSQIKWDVHYFPAWLEEDLPGDQVEIGFWLHPEGYEGRFRQNLRSYSMAGDIDMAPHGTAMAQGFHSFEHPVRIDSWQPHGHLRLRGSAIEIYYPETLGKGGVPEGSSRRELISMVSNWNAGWHTSHMYEEGVAPLIPAGAVMILTQWYDNTADNPMNPDPDVYVARGARTTDEMAHAWIAVTHLDQVEFDRLMAERKAKREE